MTRFQRSSGLLIALGFAALGLSVLACSSADEEAPAEAPQADAGKSTKKKSDSKKKKDDDKKTSSKDAGNKDASNDGNEADASPCTTPLAVGDVRVSEMMIRSVASGDDYGQWIELRNMKPCSVNLKGVKITSPFKETNGTTVIDEAALTVDTWVAPNGRVLIASSASASVNGNLPGTVVAIHQGLPNFLAASDEITLELSASVRETFKFTFTPQVGVSMAVPDDCAPADMSTLTKWKPSTKAWTTGKKGTPGAANDDVTCD